MVRVLRRSEWLGCSGGRAGQVVGVIHYILIDTKVIFFIQFYAPWQKDILQTQILVSYAFRQWFLMQCLQKDQNSCSGDALNNVKCDNPQNDLQFSNISLLYLKTSLWYPSPYILKYSHLLSGRCVWFSPMRPAVWLLCHITTSCASQCHTVCHTVCHTWPHRFIFKSLAVSSCRHWSWPVTTPALLMTINHRCLRNQGGDNVFSGHYNLQVCNLSK